MADLKGLLVDGNGNTILPTTVVDEVIVDVTAGTRLNSVLIYPDPEAEGQVDPTPGNADTLGGYPAEEYARISFEDTYDLPTPIDADTLQGHPANYYMPASYSTYSTSEQVIGTWMGKPVYRKIFTNLNFNLAGGSWGNTGILLSEYNFEIPIRATAWNNSIMLNDVRARTDEAPQLKMLTSSTMNNINTVLLEYTKTTD